MAGAGNDFPPAMAVKEFIGHRTVNAPTGTFAQGVVDLPDFQQASRISNFDKGLQKGHLFLWRHELSAPTATTGQIKTSIPKRKNSLWSLRIVETARPVRPAIWSRGRSKAARQ